MTMIRVNLPAPWALQSLDSVPLNTGFARAVLEGKVDGTFWVDRVDSPRAFHALHPYGMSLVWGDAFKEASAHVLHHLQAGAYRTDRDEWLQIDPRWQHLDWDQQLGAIEEPTTIGSSPCSRHTRINFIFDEGRFKQVTDKDELQEGWQLRRATGEDFALSGQVVPSHFWRNAEQFLAAGGGWCAEQAEEVGAIAFVSYRWNDEFEIGIETMPHARRRGLGLAVAWRLISDVLEAGLRPVWSCRMDNAASYALAQTLGFSLLRTLPYYRMSALFTKKQA